MKKVFCLGLVVIALAGCVKDEPIKVNEVDSEKERITTHLENNLAWTNDPEGKAFCTFEEFGRENREVYIWAFCQEFYVQDEKIVCPDDKTRADCFLSKTKEECKLCETNKIEPYLVEGSGVSAPVKISFVKGEKIKMWMPRDGSLYAEDIRDKFPEEFADKALMQKATRDLGLLNLEKAEEYFGAKAIFNKVKRVEGSCEKATDCEDMSKAELIRSNCPHRMGCVDNQCAVGCYDFIDRTSLPVLREGE